MAKNYYVSGNWNVTEKVCSVCKCSKTLDHFYKQTSGKFGVASRCKPCLLEANKKHVKPDETIKRLAKEIHRIEQKYPNPLSYEEIYESFKSFKSFILGNKLDLD